MEQFRVAEKAHGGWMKLYLEGNTSEVLGNMGKKVLRQYLEALASMSSALSRQLGKYDMYSMVAGMVIVFQVRGIGDSLITLTPMEPFSPGGHLGCEC